MTGRTISHRIVQNWFAEFRDHNQDYGMHP